MKKLLWIIVGLPVVLVVAMIFGGASAGKHYVNTHGEELVGRKLNVEDASFNVFTGELQLGDVTMYEKDGDSIFGSIEDLKVDIDMQELMHGKMHIEELVLNQPMLKVVQKDTVFNFDDVLEKMSEGESSEYVIDKFLLKGGEINYLDLTEPSVPFALRLDRLEINIKDFNTADRNHIELCARIGKDGEVGAVYDGMLSDQNNMTLALQLNEVDMTEFSPLFVHMFGREVLSGSLSLNTEMSIINGNIHGTNHIVISHPKVQKVKDLTFKPEYKKVPLKTALYIMTDKNGKCELDLPVTGRKSDPKFSYKRTLMKVFGRFIVKLAVSPFQRFSNNDDD